MGGAMAMKASTFASLAAWLALLTAEEPEGL